MSENTVSAMVGTGLAYLFRTFITAVDEQYSAAFTSSVDTDRRTDSSSCAENKCSDARAPSYVDSNVDRPQDAHDEAETRAFGKAKT